MSTRRDIASIVPDTSALKALAHPERLRMLVLLRLDGPATATGLAKRMGLNSGATSYHLRQLARHGFIAAADELGTGRERWWRARHESTRFDTAEAEGPALEAGMAMTQAVLSQQVQLLQAAQQAYRDLPQAWRRACTTSDVILPMRPEAAEALQARIMALLWEAKAAAPPTGAPLPEGLRNFTLILHAFPFPEIAPPPEAEGGG